MKELLRVEDLHVYYEGVHALHGISILVPEGKAVALIGANGAGKSTALKTISGIVRARSGKIAFCGRDITRAESWDIVSIGVVMVPEGRRVFDGLTTMENLLLGAHTRMDTKAVKVDLDWVFELFPTLRDRKSQSAGTLSGGEQQMLAIGRALMARPQLLMMDEPSLGLSPILREQEFEVIARIHAEGKTILLVEQNAKAALRIVDYGYVLETGGIALEGTSEELGSSDMVRKAYLGVA